MKINFTRCLIIATFGLLSACSKGQPAFQLISDEAIPRPTMEKSYVKHITTGDSSRTFDIAGECHPKVSDIKATVVGSSASALSLRESAQNVTIACSSNQTFNFTLRNLTDLGFTIADNTTYEIQLQSVTSAGLSKPSSILIRFKQNAGGEKAISVVSGASKSVVGENGYSASFIRVSGKQKGFENARTNGSSSFELSDGNANGYRAQIGVRIKSN